MRRPWVFVAEGCATGWAECPHADPVTVTRDGDRMTTCIERADLPPCEVPHDER